MVFDYTSTSRPTALATAMDSTIATVSVVDGATYPDPVVTGKQYTLILGYGSDREEVCTVTAKPTPSTFTVARGQDGTPATAKNQGDVVVHGVSARDFRRIDANEAGVADLTTRVAAVEAALPGKVNDTGDTITGDVVVSKSGATQAAVVSATSYADVSVASLAGQAAQFSMRGGAAANAPTRWKVLKADATEDFQVNRYNDAGVYVSPPVISAERATGIVSIPGLDYQAGANLSFTSPWAAYGAPYANRATRHAGMVTLEVNVKRSSSTTINTGGGVKIGTAPAGFHPDATEATGQGIFSISGVSRPGALYVAANGDMYLVNATGAAMTFGVGDGFCGTVTYRVA